MKQLIESDEYVLVHTLISHDGTMINSEEQYSVGLSQLKAHTLCAMGPAFKVGVKPGDMILIDGVIIFLWWKASNTNTVKSTPHSSQDILEGASDIVSNSPNTMYLH